MSENIEWVAVAGVRGACVRVCRKGIEGRAHVISNEYIIEKA